MKSKVQANFSKPRPDKYITDQITSYINSHKILNNKEKFLDIKPFPYLIIDDFLPPDICNQIEDYGRNIHSFNKIFHLNSKKYADHEVWNFQESIRKVIDYFYEKPFLSYLEELTGIKNLKSDYSYNWGAGFHVLPKGGFLNVHTDFNIHPHNGYVRKLNLLLYLNKHWEYKDGGSLELWDMSKKEKIEDIIPKFNRCVIFDTGEKSWHGNPRKVTHNDQTRMSLSLYYYLDFKDKKNLPKAHTTIYRDLPGQYTNFLRKYFGFVKNFIPKQLKNFLRKLF